MDDTVYRFNWGLTVRKKSERVLKLLEKGPLLKQERDRARKITRGIEGFGSFQHRSATDKAGVEQAPELFRKCNSHYEVDSCEQEDAKERSACNEGTSPQKGLSQDEAKPLLANDNEERTKNELHPFGKVEESVLLLGQS